MASIFEHEVHIEHERRPLDRVFGEPEADSSRLTIESYGHNLETTVREVVSRMPSDLYAAFRKVFQEAQP